MCFFERWRWYKSPDLYQYQHVSDVYLFNIFALLVRQRRENVGTSLETCTSYSKPQNKSFKYAKLCR